MLILHAGLIDENLYIWGEKASNEAGKEPPKKATPGGPLPFDAGGDVIRTVLANTLFDGSIRRQQPESVTAWLPTAGEDAVYVSRLRDDSTVEHGLNLWIVADNLRKGAALNAVQIAEKLVSDYLH